MSETKENLNLDCVISCIPKRHNHSHFWIEDGVFYESYNTIRGKRYCAKIEVPNMPDEDFCSKECLAYIAKEYYL